MAKKSGKNSITVLNYIYPLSGFFSAAIVFFILAFVPFVLSADVNLFVFGICMAIVFALPIFLIPFIYHAITRIKAIAMGKYHGILLVSVLLSAVSFVFIWLGINSAKMYSQFLFVISGLIVFILFSLIFSYVNFSIGARLGYSAPKRIKIISAATKLVSFAAVLVFVSVVGLKGNYLHIAYIMGVCILLSGMTAYMTTYSSIPQLIKLEVQPKSSVKDIFKRFYNVFMDKNSVLTMVGLTFNAVFAITVTVNSLYITDIYSSLINALILGASALIAFMTYFILSRISSKRFLSVANIIGAVIIVITSAEVILNNFIALPQIMLSISFILSGFSIGAGFALYKFKLNEVKQSLQITDGKSLNLRNVFISLGVGIAIGVTLCVYGLSFVVGGMKLFDTVIASFVAAAAIASMTLSLIKTEVNKTND